MGPPPAELADNVDNGCRHTRVFVGIHQPIFNFRPRCTQGLGVYER